MRKVGELSLTLTKVMTVFPPKYLKRRSIAARLVPMVNPRIRDVSCAEGRTLQGNVLNAPSLIR